MSTPKLDLDGLERKAFAELQALASKPLHDVKLLMAGRVTPGEVLELIGRVRELQGDPAPSPGSHLSPNLREITDTMLKSGGLDVAESPGLVILSPPDAAGDSYVPSTDDPGSCAVCGFDEDQHSAITSQCPQTEGE